MFRVSEEGFAQKTQVEGEGGVGSGVVKTVHETSVGYGPEGGLEVQSS